MNLLAKRWPAMPRHELPQPLSDGRKVEVERPAWHAPPIDKRTLFQKMRDQARAMRFSHRKLDLSRRMILGTMFAVASVTTVEAAGAGRLRFARGGGYTPPASGQLAPTAQWGAAGGVAGAGYNGAGLARPTAPAADAAAPAGRLLNDDRVAFGENLTLVCPAETTELAGGVASVDFFADGNKVTVAERSVTTHYDKNNSPWDWEGFACTLDWAACMALAPLGCVEVWVRINPVNPALSAQVVGPYYFYPRNPGVGAGCVISKQIYVDKSASSDTLDVRYRTLIGALARCVAHPEWEFPEIILERNGDHPFQVGLQSDPGPRARMTRICAAPGISAGIGDGSALYEVGGQYYDGLSFEGFGIKVELQKVNPTLSGFRLRGNHNKLLRFLGCEYFVGTHSYFLGSGAGMTALYEGKDPAVMPNGASDNSRVNVTFGEVYAHDLPGYGLSGCMMVRNCTLDGVSGSAHENVWGMIYGGTTKRIGGIIPGMRGWKPAMTLVNTGGSTITFEVTKNVGAGVSNGLDPAISRYLIVRQNGTTVLNMGLNMTAGSTTTVAQVAAALNGLGITGFSASEVSQPMAAAYFSMEANGNAGPIAERAITSTATRIDTFVDIHADLLVWHGNAVTYNNMLVKYLRGEQVVGSAQLSVNTLTIMRNVVISNVAMQDSSVSAWGMSGYSASYLSGYFFHFGFTACTFVGGISSIGVQATFDAWCSVAHSHFNVIGFATRAGAELPYPTLAALGLSVAQGSTLLPGADARSKVQTVPTSSILAQIANDNAPDFAPIGGYLQLNDNSWAGAERPKVSGVKQWNRIA